MEKHLMYINGQFTESETQEWMDVTNPSTDEVISQVPKATKNDVARAIDAADAAQSAWEETPAVERGKYLHAIANGIRAQADSIARLISEEVGKTLELSTVEVHFTADYLDYMAEWARRYEGEIVQSDRDNENIFVFKRAIGVTTGILPWNFPFFLIARKMAPALITGNTIVVKPSVESPNNAIAFTKIVDKVGLPKGVYNLVTGRGGEVGNELASNPKVGMVSLTGSVPAGQKVMEAAAENIIKVSLELGGKAPAIVMADADLDLAVKAIVDSRVINTGQVCNCAERVYVHESIKDEFTARLVEAMKAVKYGNPLVDTGIQMGPLINKAAQDSVQQKVDRAVEEGAKVLLGGKKVEGTGSFYEPTVIAGATNKMEIVQEEIFGPVIPIVTFATLDEAIELANDSEFGLTSSLYTQNLNVAMKVIKRLKYGETYINRENFEAMQGFHAGWRKSGIGGADGKHGLNEYLQTQVVYLQYDKSVN
ncbi:MULTISPECIES: aldehyde dehydrogenase [unclassified Paenibacillus]|uniref:aldehyde dehydrogenase n=1 Tax=unclassified Paenibacillus TaxID=185978 RepID=UPI0024075D38|nr:MULTISPECIES: aldehyde dehydrogenase [unclassified Paenibacillus]MDF9839367.1 lactaldehyde dehydrogenase/glycolaldehyde dehydrogenase [Paenibacillus sp. PastF-2]MDF9845948.1 lactaldehyde dehydrogenase/glycolaldehyde dehydrogenase [Paenibacillus sp. PastM-2]MDF9852521.1 lactaldehyde dehydrogenase/glycolaldehyde dehydrogenase [Paenibacillus sp. PastF-1]MDH6477749.1 lactaldehyde dehydrogenase/glycolaldehyde dehydrogenase [Paenibacillus sp. PastH-2]MDH6505488.1 lactaldehyde dehydrogenase/glycol